MSPLMLENSDLSFLRLKNSVKFAYLIDNILKNLVKNQLLLKDFFNSKSTFVKIMRSNKNLWRFLLRFVYFSDFYKKKSMVVF